MAATNAAYCCRPLDADRLSEEEARVTAALFKALADPARVRLVNLLATCGEDAVCVCDLTAPIGLAQPTVSHHLKKLREAGLVTVERRGTWAYYALAPDALDRLARVADLRPHTAERSQP